MFNQEQDAVSAVIESWIRRHVPFSVIISIVAIGLFASLVLGAYDMVSKGYEVFVRWQGLNAAVKALEKAGTGKFLSRLQLQLFDQATTVEVEQKFEVDQENCSLSVTKDSRKEELEADKPRRVERTRSTDRFSIKQLSSLGFFKGDQWRLDQHDAGTRTVFFILTDNASSTEEGETDKVSHFVSKSTVEVEMYSQDLNKLKNEMLLLLNSCGASGAIFIDGEPP
jgi:hypothetical protein